MPGRDKVKYILLMTVFYLGLYVLIQSYVTTHEFDFITEVDKAIPFMPQHIWIYHTMLPAIVATMLLLVKSRQLFLSVFWACFTTAVILNISYIYFPSFYPRPSFEVNTLSEALVHLTYKLDGSGNTFPSGHVAFAWIMFLGAAYSKIASEVSGLRLLYLLWAIGISLSTLTLKQHYIVDVLSGIALALTSFYISCSVIKSRISHSD